MPAFTILLGAVLMIIGIGTYSLAESGDRPFGLLLPAIFGLIALALGIASLVKKDLKMHLMHAAVLLASLGVLVPVGLFLSRLVEIWNEQRNDALIFLGTVLSVTASGGYVYAAIQSFRAARRTRKDDTHDKPDKDDKPEPPKTHTTPIEPTDAI